MAVLLYEHPLSSYAQKIKIALREKGVAFNLKVTESFGTGRANGPCAATPRARTPARITEEVCDTQHEAVNWGFGEVLWFRRATGLLGEALRAEAARHTAVLQDWLGARLGDGPWFGGTAFGWADAAAAPMVNRSVHYGMGPPPGSALAGWHRRVRERPSVAAVFAEFDAEAAHLYTTGGRREYRDHWLEWMWMVKSGAIEVVLAGLGDGNIRFPWPGTS